MTRWIGVRGLVACSAVALLATACTSGGGGSAVGGGGGSGHGTIGITGVLHGSAASGCTWLTGQGQIRMAVRWPMRQVVVKTNPVSIVDIATGKVIARAGDQVQGIGHYAGLSTGTCTLGQPQVFKIKVISEVVPQAPAASRRRH